jgi:transcriptional regulator GlxA family with amidase domain
VSRLTPDGHPIETIVILAYDGVAADEASVLVDILTAADLDVTIASVQAKPVTSYNGRLVPSRPAAAMGRCSAIIVPGGLGVRTTSANPGVLKAIAELASQSRWIGATSTGSVLLAAAGVIDGARVTTHWLAGDLITERGLELADESFVEWGRLLTASGIVGTATLSFRVVGALLGVEAERQVRDRFVPPDTSRDRRYDRTPQSPWRKLGRTLTGRRWAGFGKQVVDEEFLLSTIDPRGQADVVVLDLFGDD